MIRILSLVALALLPLNALGAAKFKIIPAEGPYFLDDTIEIIFEKSPSDRPSIRTPGSETTTNFTISSVTYFAGGKELGRLILQPVSEGPASFGPADIRTTMGNEPVAHLPRLDFDIQPPLDTGTAPLEQLFADQKLHGRQPAAIRAEVIGAPMLGRAFVIRWFLYSERGLGEVRFPPFEIAGAPSAESSYYSSSAEASFTDISGSLVQRRLIREYITIPESAAKLEMPPVWSTIRFLPDTIRETGLTTTRRIMTLPPITVAPRPANAPAGIPLGSFEIECPKQIGSTNEHRVQTSVVIKGDGTIKGSKLRFEGDAPTPLLVDGPNLHYPSYRDGKMSLGGTFNLWAGPIEEGQLDVAFPAIVFDYYDLASNRRRTLQCRAKTLSLARDTLRSGERAPVPKRQTRRELPKRTNTIFYLGEVLALLFVVGAAFVLVLAIRRP